MFLVSFVANTAMIMREENSALSTRNLYTTKSECADVRQKQIDTNDTIDLLLKENKNMSNELENLANFIELCYEELQTIRNENFNDPSVIQQLKKIIICCGQYYADSQNERKKNKQLEQKHCFLKNKLSILDKNLEAVSEEVKCLRLHNMRLQNENSILKDKMNKINNVNTERRSKSEHRIRDKSENIKNSTNSIYLSPCCFDLKPHLKIVRKLLNDQNELIKDFKAMSDMFVA